LLVVTEHGYGKRTPIEEYPCHGRGGSGVITAHINDKTGNIAAARIITDKDNDLMIISAGGVVIRTNVNAIRVLSRSTQGVSLMHLSEGDSVVAVSTTNGKKLAPESEAEVSDGEGEENGDNEAYEENGDSGEMIEENGEDVVEENGEGA
jgi:DNA gyrase subunit A